MKRIVRFDSMCRTQSLSWRVDVGRCGRRRAGASAAAAAASAAAASVLRRRLRRLLLRLLLLRAVEPGRRSRRRRRRRRRRLGAAPISAAPPATAGQHGVLRQQQVGPSFLRPCRRFQWPRFAAARPTWHETALRQGFPDCWGRDPHGDIPKMAVFSLQFCASNRRNGSRKPFLSNDVKDPVGFFDASTRTRMKRRCIIFEISDEDSFH